MKININTASYLQLNHLVAICEGRNPSVQRNGLGDEWINYTTDPVAAYEIICRERIANDYRINEYEQCVATVDSWDNCYYGNTPLIASMRAYVASKLGDEIDVDVELTYKLKGV